MAPKRPLTDNEQRDRIIAGLIDFQRAAHKIGLHITAQALNRAQNTLGWEAAGNTERAAMAMDGKRGEGE